MHVPQVDRNEGDLTQQCEHRILLCLIGCACFDREGAQFRYTQPLLLATRFRFSRRYKSRTRRPNIHRKPTTLVKRKPSANPSACLPAAPEKRPATRTLGASRKRAPLRQSRCLSCSESLASPKQAQLRSAPRTS